MKKLFVLALLYVLCRTASDVVVLTDENFEDTIKNNSVVMVKFHAPWCGHCKSLAPEYEKVATLAKQQNLPYIIAEVDATIHRVTSDNQEIKGFPTMRLFINSEVVEYDGERNAEAILSFIKRNVMPVRELKSVEEIENLRKSRGLMCIIVGDVLSTFIRVAKTEGEFEFFSAKYEDMVKVFPDVTKGCVVLLKDFDEGFSKLTKELTEVNLKEFLETEMLQTVNAMSQKIFDQVFKPNKRTGIFLIRSDTDPNLKTYQTEFLKVAKFFKSKDFVFIETNGQDNWGHKTKTALGIEEQPLPLIAAALKNDSVIKYLYKGDITEKNIKDFVEKVRERKAEVYYKSESIPINNPGPVYTVVSKNFKEEVLDNDDDIMVKFYTRHCGHCKKLVPIYEKLAEGMTINKKLKFMEVDVTKNDIKGHPVSSVPVIKFFPGKDKSNVQVFSGERKENVIAEFIKKHSSYQIELPDFLTTNCDLIEVDDL